MELFLKRNKKRNKNQWGNELILENEKENDNEDIINENDESEDASLIRKKTPNKLRKYRDSPYYGSGSGSYPVSPFLNRNINTPIDNNFDIHSLSSVNPNDGGFFKKILKTFYEMWPKANHKQENEKNRNNKQIFLTKFFDKYSDYFKAFKTLILVVFCLFCIVIFSIYEDKEDNWTQTIISNLTVNQFKCHSSSYSSRYYKFMVNGPFLSENDISKTEINSGKYVTIDLYAKGSPNKQNNSIFESTWKLLVKIPDTERSKSKKAFINTEQFSQNSILSNVFELPNNFNTNQLDFYISTNIMDFLPFNYNCIQLSDQYEYAIVYSAILLVFVYALIIFELTHRTLAACLGSLGGISLLALVDMERPSLKTIVTWVEWETILLMFGMMIIVAIFCETGFFDLISVRIFHYSGNRIWIMIGSLCLLSAFLSAFLDNVTTILLLTPITIRLCDVSKLDPRYIIIAIVIFSNIGGTSTAIGDPPNVIITANDIIQKKGVDFTNFTLHMFVGCLFIYVICFIHFRFLYADTKNFEISRDTEFEELKKEISIWTRTYQSVTPVTKEEKIVKTLIKEKASQLEYLLAQKINENKIEFENDLKIKSQGMIENYKINNKPLLAKCSIIFSVALILFFLHPFIHVIHLSIGWISILAALILLAASTNNQTIYTNESNEIKHADDKDVELENVSSHKDSNEEAEELNKEDGHSNHQASLHGIDLEGLVHKVEWTTLLFFAGLFIFMKCIEELGLLNYLGNLISDLIKTFHNKSDRLAFALLILIILSALISSIIDNIPFTTAMIPIILQLSDQADLPIQPLVYALAFGSCLGGNGTLIGASCNLVAAGISEQHGCKITFKQFFLTSFPIMISSVLVAIVYVCVTCIYLEWY